MADGGILIHERVGGTDGCSLASWNNQLCLAWTGNDYRLNLLWSPDGGLTFGHKQTLHHRSSHAQSNGPTPAVIPLAPALLSLHDQLYMSWICAGRQHVNVMSLGPGGTPSWHRHDILAEARSPRGPALAGDGSGLVVAWIGSDRHLNLARANGNGPFGPPITYEHTSSHPPSLVQIGSDLVLTWTGTDRRLNLALVRNGQVLPPVTLPYHTQRRPALIAGTHEIILAWRERDWRVSIQAFTPDLQPGRFLTTPGWSRQAPALAIHHGRLLLATVGSGRRITVTPINF